MRYISFQEDTKVFTLHTKTSMYQMQVGQFGTLLHLYYGVELGDTWVAHGIVNLDRGFSGNPYEADRDRTFSLDVLPQEYTAEGNGDYRIQGIEAEHEDGSHILQLKYDSHEIRKGKYALAGMPAMFAGEDEAETLKITLKDELSGVCVNLLYGVIWDCDIITRAVEVVNRGSASVTLRRVMSAELDFPRRPMDMIHFYGRHSMERLTERQPLRHGIQSVESKRGISSHHHNPAVIFCDRTATEDYGECFGITFVYSGNFICQAELDQVEQTRVVMGIHPYQFAWTLKPGETFVSPEAAMSFSGTGLETLSHHFHDGFREHLIRSGFVKKPRPILVNNWEATYFEFDEQKLYDIAKAAKEVGIEMFVLDDGWFGKRDSDYTGLGDWYVNEEKIHGGLPKLVGKIRDLGLKFGIWLEPEMVSEDSDLYRRHPDWCLRVPGRLPVRSRSQLNLDVTKKEVRDYIMEQIFKVIDSCQADYIKWDVNRALGNVFSQGVEAGRQGEVFHRHMLGVYDMMERLIARYPNLLFETCAGGGGRFDAGMLYYSPQIWCSDNTDAADRLEIHYGTSFFYPISTFGAHVSVCPNHQTGRTTSLRTRGTVAGSGTFGYELDLGHMDEEEKKAATAQIAQFKAAESLVQTGDYYRLSAPGDRSNSVFWEFVSKDKKDVLVSGVVLRSEVNPPVYFLRFRGLNPDRLYREKESGETYSGIVLMKAGLAVPVTSEDYEAVAYRFEVVEKEEKK